MVRLRVYTVEAPFSVDASGRAWRTWSVAAPLDRDAITRQVARPVKDNAGQPSRWSRSRGTRQRLGPGRLAASSPAGATAKSVSTTTGASASAGASTGSVRSVDDHRREAARAGRAAGTRRRTARPGPGRARRRRTRAGAGAPRPPRPARRSAGPPRRCPDRRGRSRPRWPCGPPSAPSRSASTGSTTPSAWPSTSTPPAAARTPRSPSTVRGRPRRRPRSGRRWWRSRRRRRAPARPQIRASSTAAVPHGVRRGHPHEPAEPGRRPPGRARRARAAGTARPARRGRAPARSRPARGSTLSQVTTVRPVARSSGERVVAGLGVAGEHDRVADRARPAGPRCAAGRPGRRRRAPPSSSTTPGRVLRSIRTSAGSSGPACTCTTCAPAEHGDPVARLGGRSAAPRRRPPAAARHPPTSRLAAPARPRHPGAADTARTAASMPVSTSAAVVGCSANPASAAVGADQHGLRPRGTHVEADRGGLIGGHGRRA